MKKNILTSSCIYHNRQQHWVGNESFIYQMNIKRKEIFQYHFPRSPNSLTSINKNAKKHFMYKFNLYNAAIYSIQAIIPSSMSIIHMCNYCLSSNSTIPGIV